MRLPGTWPASCESRTNEVLDQVVSSVAEATKKRYISQKMLRLPHFSALGRATKAPGKTRRPDQVVGATHDKDLEKGSYVCEKQNISSSSMNSPLPKHLAK